MLYEKFDDVDWVTPDLKQFAEYWRSLDRDRLVPRRSSFDPSKIHRLLQAVAIYEVVSQDEIVYRLAGTSIVERFGMEVTGRNVLDFWEGEARENAAAAIHECVTRPCGMFTNLIGVTASGRVENSYAVGFPLLDDKDVCNRLMFYSSEFQYANERLTSEDKITSLSGAKTIFVLLD
ncbi:MAG: PAS domain-containing protein [Sneathiella sp.]